MEYQEFLARKKIDDQPTGLTEIPDVNPMLFEFQRDIVRWALRRGRANVWADCGLGKTPMQLEWCNQIVEHTGRPALILAPLAVSRQTRREGDKFGIKVHVCENQDDVKIGVNITNYEKLEHFDLSAFGALALDESSILKNYAGKMRNQIIEQSAAIPYRTAWSATPAPNDFMELGNHTEYCGVMTRSEMLAMFFVHDGGDTSQWRLKGHAESEFWRWLCAFSVMIRKPSDFGYEDGRFILPELRIHDHVIDVEGQGVDTLFEMPAITLQERRKARQNSIDKRCAKAAEIAMSTDGPCLLWCDLNEESKRLAKMTGAYEVTGSMKDQDKERGLLGFRDGTYRVLVTKPSIAGFGMNWQHCARMIFTGLSDSYEQYYQAVRRCWRFGQNQPVDVHIVTSSTEGEVVANIRRKDTDSENMVREMVKHMKDLNAENIRGTGRQKTGYEPTHDFELPKWMVA